MTRQHQWHRWILTIMLSIGILILLAIGTEAIKNIKTEEAMVMQVNSEQIEEGINLQTETKESDSFTSFVTMPLINNEEIDDFIQERIVQQEQKFHAFLEEEQVLHTNNQSAHFNVQTHIHKISNTLYSFILMEEQLINNEPIYSEVHTYTIDVERNHLLQLAHLFNEDHLKVELDSLFQQSSLTDQINEAQLTQNLETSNWSLEDNDLVFYINPTDVQMPMDHPIHVKVPLIHVYTNLQDSYKDDVISKKVAKEIEIIEKDKTIDRIRELDPSGKYIALTFDDGPHAEHTRNIVNHLKKYDAKATFYMLGSNVQLYPNTARTVAKAGHEIANHTVSHVNLNAVNQSRMTAEIKQAQKQITEITGITPTTFRPPYGEYNDKVIEVSQDMNNSVVMWSIDTLDWKIRDANAIYQTVKYQARPNSIVLMHDIHRETAAAVPMILEDLSNRGYEFVTVSELLPLLETEEVFLYFGE